LNKLEETRKLKSLLDYGAITDNEFQMLKRKVLDFTYQQESTAVSVPLSRDDSIKYTTIGNFATIGNFGSVEESERNTTRLTIASNLAPGKEITSKFCSNNFAVASAIAVFAMG
jgi:hypothetical protein